MITVPEKEKTASSTKSTRGWIAGTLAVVGCMVACSLPLLATGGLLAGLGALAAGWWFAAIVALFAAAIAVIVVRRRNAVPAGATDAACDCGGTC